MNYSESCNNNKTTVLVRFTMDIANATLAAISLSKIVVKSQSD